MTSASAISLSHASPDYLDRRASFTAGSEVFHHVNFWIQCSGRTKHYERHGVAADWKAVTDAITVAQTYECPCKKVVSLSFTINNHGI